MATISSDMIKELRERTQAGLLDCKKALTECDGDMEKSIALLRKKGLSAAAKKAGRIATEGSVVSYVHGGRIGVLLEVNCETDFVAGTEAFRTFCSDVAMQIAAMSPEVVSREDLGADVIAREREILREKVRAEGKPEQVADRIVDGQLNKWFSERVLLEQKFVKDDKKTVLDLAQELVAKVGENVKIRRFSRFELGEGLEKRKDDFAAEVAAQVAGS